MCCCILPYLIDDTCSVNELSCCWFRSKTVGLMTFYCFIKLSDMISWLFCGKASLKCVSMPRIRKKIDNHLSTLVLPKLEKYNAVIMTHSGSFNMAVLIAWQLFSMPQHLLESCVYWPFNNMEPC